MAMILEKEADNYIPCTFKMYRDEHFMDNNSTTYVKKIKIRRALDLKKIRVRKYEVLIYE